MEVNEVSCAVAQLAVLTASEVELGGVLEGEFQEDKAPRVFRSGDLRGESRAQTEPQRSARSPSGVFSSAAVRVRGGETA